MQELDPMVLWAVFHEMFGVFLWLLVVLVPLVLLALIVLLVRERRVCGKRLAWSLVLGLIGGVFGEIIIVKASSSGFSDAGGPVDWVLIELIFIAGTAAATLVFYTLAGWWALLRHSSTRTSVSAPAH